LEGAAYVPVGVTVVCTYVQSTPHCLFGDEQVFGVRDRPVFATIVVPTPQVLPTVEGLLLLEHAP
jgi:hypothetical protein